MAANRPMLYAYRAVFGAGFVVLGGVTLWRVAVTAAPPNTKILGLLLACAMIALGLARIVQYVRYRRTAPRT
ncbi:MAG TPA: hypothetical protein VHT53_14395 [Candidatus Elarobacter sp.]|jgi:hypothetical protein|nr:hypothetical protein [Candidatus Elarobacter sp.]